jgi:hypothetical protein
MRIKHWAGYGCVEATKGKTYPCGDGKVVEVLVKGNHERGLDRPFHDVYCFEKWLGRFCKGWRLIDYKVVSNWYGDDHNEYLSLDLLFRKEN